MEKINKSVKTYMHHVAIPGHWLLSRGQSPYMRALYRELPQGCLTAMELGELYLNNS